MDWKVGKKYHGQTPFMGAILMSNRVTKQECLRRKLFGLPSSKYTFIKQVKAGMLLFLFEHEERKLYGVFEATSDGALNIEPNAFLGHGISFPAQVLFKRIWMCKPLMEPEFCDAIKENYFAPNKFNFGLSRDQVFRLVELFSFKKICIEQYQRPGIPNEIIKQFEKSVGDKVRITGRSWPEMPDSYEYRKGGGRHSQKNFGLSRSNTTGAKSCQKFNRRKPSFANNGCRSHVTPQHSTEASPQRWLRYECGPPYLTCSTSSSDASNCRIFSEHPVNDCHGSQGFVGIISSSTLHSNDPSLPQEPVSYIESSSDKKSHQLCPSHIGSDALHCPSTNLKESSCPWCNPSDRSPPPARSDDHLNFHNCDSVFRHEHYDPSNPRISFSPAMATAKGLDSLPGMHLNNSYGYSKAWRQEFESAGRQYGGLGLASDNIPLPIASSADKNVGSSHSNGPPKDTLATYSSEYMEEDDLEGIERTAAAPDEEYYPSVVKSRLCSDTEQERTSVFSRLTKALDSRSISKTQEAYHVARVPIASRLSRAPEFARLSGTTETSCLSRTPEVSPLPKIPEASHLCKSLEAFQRYKARESLTSFSQDQLAAILSQKRRRLIEVTDEPHQGIPDGDQELECKASIETSKVTCVKKVEENNEVIPRILIAEKRSRIRRLYGENGLNVIADSALDEESPQKRSKFLGLSNEQECKGLQGSIRDIVLVRSLIENTEKEIECKELHPPIHLDSDSKNSKKEKDERGSNCKIDVIRTVAENIERNIETSKLSPTHHLDTNNKSGSVSVASARIVASDKTVNYSEDSTNSQSDLENSSVSKGCHGEAATHKTESIFESSKNQRKEVSNRNLRWFLQKSVDGHVKGSAGDCVNQKPKDEYSCVTSEVSMLPANRHGDKEINNITEANVSLLIDQKN